MKNIFISLGVAFSHRYTPLRLPMLDAAAHYQVTELRPENVVPASHQAPLLDAIGSAGGMPFSGAWLVHAGLPVPHGKAETAYIVWLKKCGSGLPASPGAVPEG